MKRLMFLCLGMMLAGSAVAQDESMPAMGAPEEMKAIAMLAGDWDVAMKFRMSEEMPWQESTGTQTSTMILDGSCLMTELRATMMGFPLKGIQLTTYNRASGMWQAVWVDNMQAFVSHYEGPMKDEAIVFEGEDFMPGGQKYNVRMTWWNMSADKYEWKMEMSVDGGSNWMENMQATYTRKSTGGEDTGGW